MLPWSAGRNQCPPCIYASSLRTPRSWWDRCHQGPPERESSRMKHQNKKQSDADRASTHLANTRFTCGDFCSCSSHFISSHFCFCFSLSPSRPRPNSDAGSLSRRFFPSPHYNTCLFVTARRTQPFLPSSTHIELRLPTLKGALSSSFLLLLTLQK